MPKGSVFECHLNIGQADHLNNGQNGHHLVFLCTSLVFKCSVQYIGHCAQTNHLNPEPFEILTLKSQVFKFFLIFRWSVFRSTLEINVNLIFLPTQILKLHDKEIILTSKDNDAIFEHLKTSQNAEGSRLRYHFNKTILQM